MEETSLEVLTVRELIGLLACTEEQIGRLRTVNSNIDERTDTVDTLVRQQHEVLDELRRRRG